MSDHEARVESFVREFRELSTDDQYLVMALVARLHATDGAVPQKFSPDVPFMDFDE